MRVNLRAYLGGVQLGRLGDVYLSFPPVVMGARGPVEFTVAQQRLHSER